MKNQRVQLGNGTLDLLNHVLCDPHGLELRMTQKSAQVLHLLTSNEGKVVSHQELIDTVWDSNYYIGPKRLNDEIWKIRNHLKQARDMGVELKTCHRKGYILVHLEPDDAPVDHSAHTPASSSPRIEPVASTMGRLRKRAHHGAGKTLTLLPLLVLLIASNPGANPESPRGDNSNYNPLSLDSSEAVDFFVQLFRAESRKTRRDDSGALRNIVGTAEASLANFEGSLPTKAWLQEGLAKMHMSMGDASAAEQAISSALETKRLVFPAQSKELVETQLTQANIYWINSQFDQALQVFTSALANSQDVPGLELEQARAHFGMGALNWYLEENDESERHLLAALKGFQERGEAARPHLARTLEYLGQLNERLGRYAESETLYAQSQNIVHEVFGDNSERMAGLLTKKAHLLIHTGRSEQAVGLLNHASGIYTASTAYENLALGVVNGNLADAYLRLNQVDLAREHAVKAVGILIRSGGPRQPLLAHAFATLGDVNSTLGLGREAEVNYIKSYIIFSQAYGPDHPETLQAGRRLPAKSINAQADQAGRDSLGVATAQGLAIPIVTKTVMIEA